MSKQQVGVIASIGVALAAVAVALSYKKQLQKERQNRADERKGRINAERRLAEGKDARSTSRTNQPTPSFNIWSIGTVDSVYTKRFGTPRQPGLVNAPTAVIRLNPALSNCLQDLDQYSHVWVIYWFHRNTNRAKLETAADQRPFDAVKALINVPRHDFKVGVFACRSPHRPNSIGLSLARIVAIDKATATIKLAGLDAVDGSPVLDIKPYLPGVEAVESARVPEWVSEGYSDSPHQSPPLLVQWKIPRELPEKTQSVFFTEEEILQVIEETLGQGDLRSRHQRESSDSWKGQLEVGGWVIEYLQKGMGLEIVGLTKSLEETDVISDQ